MASESTIPLEALALVEMASGHFALDLTETIGWEAFPEYAEQLARIVGGTLGVAVDTVDMRMLDVHVDGAKLHLVSSDYPMLVSLEAETDDGDVAVRAIHAKLKESAGG